MLSVLAAPVSCNAIRKSEAWRTPGTRPFCIGMTVGRPAPAHSAIWSKPSAKAPSIVKRAAEAHPAIHRERGAALEQEADDLQEILVPAHRDAVFGDAAEPGHRRARRAGRTRLGDVADRRERTRSPAATPEMSGGSGSIFSPSIGGDEMPVIDQVMRQGEAGGAEPDDQHLVARCRLRQRPAQVERVPAGQQADRSRSPTAAPARPSACGSRSAGCRPGPAADRCTTSCSRCRCGGRWRRIAGCRPRRWRARRRYCRAP